MVGSVAAGLSVDGEPTLDHIVAELTRRRLLTMIGHEAVDEGVCCRLHQDTRERSVEEVWVGLLLGVETLGTEGCQGLHGHEATRRSINQFLELVGLGFVVVAICNGQLLLSHRQWKCRYGDETHPGKDQVSLAKRRSRTWEARIVSIFAS